MALPSPSSQLDALSGKTGSDAAKLAALQQILSIGQATDVQVGQQAGTAARFDPFINAGTSQLPGLEASATPEGFSANLEAIISSGALDPIIAERTQAAQRGLKSAGLSRSGFGARTLGDIPSEAILGLEGVLQGRSTGLAGQGFQATRDLAGFDTGSAANISNLLVGKGQAQAAGTLGAAQAQTQGAQNLFDISASGAEFSSSIITDIFGALFGGGGG